jgi:hypothetical protein
MQPSHGSGLVGGGGGVIKAIGSPLRVTMIDFPVFLTLSNKRKHVALNFEIVMVSCMYELPFICFFIITIVNDYGQSKYFLSGMMETTNIFPVPISLFQT